MALNRNRIMRSWEAAGHGIASLLANANAFPDMVIQELKKEVTSAPAEGTIANEIIDKTNLIYVDQVGFYIWDKRIWRKKTDADKFN